MSYYSFNREEVLQKGKEKYNNGGGKKNLLNIIRQTKLL